MTSGIYKITIGENFYFGSAVNLKNREWKHRGELRAGSHRNRFMQRAWDKHGVMGFEVVEFCKPADLVACEQVHISQWFDHPKCMNLSPTAGNSLGVKHTEEARRNMSLAHIGKFSGTQHPQYGKPRSAETREKLRAAQTGKKFTDETRAKHKAALNHPGVKIRMVMAHLGRKQSPQWVDNRMRKAREHGHPRSKSVEITMPSGEVKVFRSCHDAAEAISVNRPTLNRWLIGSKAWPGQGHHNWKSTAHLIGLTGRYL